MFDAFQRFKRANINDQAIRVIYLGDYDPSWIDMIRDIRDRTIEFIGDDEFDFKIVPIALTRQQIDLYDPPPNPAKRTDPRSKGFIDNHWTTSWEVDALKPEILNKILTDSIVSIIDLDIYNQVLNQEKEDIKTLEKIRDYFEA